MLIHTISYTLCHFSILSSLVCFYIYTLDNTLYILSKYLTIRSYSWRALSFTVSYLSDIRTLFQKTKNRHTTCLFFYFPYFLFSPFYFNIEKKHPFIYNSIIKKTYKGGMLLWNLITIKKKLQVVSENFFLFFHFLNRTLNFLYFLRFFLYYWPNIFIFNFTCFNCFIKSVRISGFIPIHYLLLFGRY